MKEQCMLICCTPSHLKEIYCHLVSCWFLRNFMWKKKDVLCLLEFTVLLDLMSTSVMVYITLIGPNKY